MAEIAVQIGADVSKLLDSLSKSEKALARLGLNIGKVNEDLKKQTSIVARTSGSIEDLKNQYKSGSVTLDFYNRNLLRLEKVQKKYENSSKDLGNSLRKLKSDYKLLGGSTLPASKGITKMGRSSANAVPAVTEFSRVLQDAPFGIQGVANNITQLTQNFGYLSKSAGGTVPALKAMLSTLTGPAGILLAVSAVTSLMVSYGDELLNLVGSSNKLAKASAEYVGSAEAEIIALKQLVSIANDENNSKKVRQGAIDEINKNYSKYLGNLDLESVKTDAVKSSIDALTISLIKQAKIKGIADIISDQTKEDAEDLLSLDLERQRLLKSTIDLQQKLNKTTAGRRKFQLNRQLESSEVALKSVNKEIQKIESNAEKSLKPFLELQKTLKEDVLGGVLGGSGGGSGGKTTAKRKIQAVVELESPKESQANFDKYAKGAISILKDSFKIEGGLGSELINVDAVNNDIQRFIETFKPLEDKLEEIPLKTQIFTDALSSSFGALANQISSSFETGNAIIDSFVSSIIGSLGRLLAEMVATSIAEKAIAGTKIATNKAVATSAAISAAAQSGAATGPAGFFTTPGFVAGLLAVVGGAFAGISSFAKGGFSGDDNLAFLNKNELVLRPMEQAALYNAIRGRSFSSIGSDNRNNNNSIGENIIGTATLRGSNQYIQFKRSQRKMNRFYSS